MGGQPFTRQEAPGALPNGTNVVLVKPLGHDHESSEELEVGDRGVVLGSSVITHSDEGLLPEPEIGYSIEWDRLPKEAWSAMADAIEPLRQDESAK